MVDSRFFTKLYGRFGPIGRHTKGTSFQRLFPPVRTTRFGHPDPDRGHHRGSIAIRNITESSNRLLLLPDFSFYPSWVYINRVLLPPAELAQRDIFSGSVVFPRLCRLFFHAAGGWGNPSPGIFLARPPFTAHRGRLDIFVYHQRHFHSIHSKKKLLAPAQYPDVNPGHWFFEPLV